MTKLFEKIKTDGKVLSEGYKQAMRRDGGIYLEVD